MSFSWWHRRLQRKYHWQFSGLYWGLLHRWQIIRLWLGKQVFGARQWLKSERESASIFASITRIIVRQTLWAIFLVGALGGVEYWLVVRIGVIDTPLPKPEFMRHLVLAFSQTMHLLHLVRLQLNPDAYIVLLNTMAQVMGGFLALYFTAVSVVASTVYAKVAGDVRSLLMREKVGNFYIRIVALLVAVTMLLLAQASLGFSLGILNLCLVTFLGMVGIFSFVILGMRAFYFFDPTALVEYLAQDLGEWIRSTTPAGFQWQDPSFQAHYQEQAINVLTTYRNIVNLASSETDVGERSITKLAHSALVLLSLYVKDKFQIPSDSHWFRRTYKHRDWLTADYTIVDLALHTGTSVQPEVVPDPMWVESEIEGIVIIAMRTLLDRDDLRSTIEICHSVQHVMNNLAGCLAVDESLHLLHALRPLVSTKIRGVEVSVENLEDKAEDFALFLGLIDSYGLWLISILLGFSEAISRITADSFGHAISQINWTQPKTIHAAKLPRLVIKQLEDLSRSLAFERQIEGCVISPLWYQQQIAAVSLIRFLSTVMRSLIEELEIAYTNEVAAFISERRYVFAAQVIQRGLEGCHKFAVHSDKVKACFDRLSALRRATDISWPTMDWEGFSKRINCVREQLIISLARSFDALINFPQSKHWPDYFGQAYSILAQECYMAMATGDEVLFQEIFPPFFRNFPSASARLYTSDYGPHRNVTSALVTAPIVDVFQLSGYALIYTELQDKDYWQIVQQLWNDYLTQHPNLQDFSELVGSLSASRQSLYVNFSSRGLNRTSWKQDFIRQLHVYGLPNDTFPYGLSDDGEEEDRSQHPSPIIRVIARSGPIFYDPQDVFISVYLKAHPELSDIRLSERAQSFAELLRREQSNH